MTKIQDTDFLLVNRGGVDHKITASALQGGTAKDTDLLLIYRSGRDYALPAAEIEALTDDADLLVVNRDGVDYQVSGKDLKEYLYPSPASNTLWHLQNFTDQEHVFANYSGKGWPRLATDIDGSNPRMIDSIPAQTEVLVDSGPDASGMLGGFGTNYEGFKGIGPLTNTSGVTNMSNLFSIIFYFDGTYLDTSSCEDMSNMFSPYAGKIVNIGHWDTSKVKDMHSMFHGEDNTHGRVYIESSLHDWDTSNVTNMAGMFHDAALGAPLLGEGLQSWKTGNVTNMDNMFQNASGAYGLLLFSWCVSQFSRQPVGFSLQTPGWGPEKQPQWGTCPNP